MQSLPRRPRAVRSAGFAAQSGSGERRRARRPGARRRGRGRSPLRFIADRAAEISRQVETLRKWPCHPRRSPAVYFRSSREESVMRAPSGCERRRSARCELERAVVEVGAADGTHWPSDVHRLASEAPVLVDPRRPRRTRPKCAWLASRTTRSRFVLTTPAVDDRDVHAPLRRPPKRRSMPAVGDEIGMVIR